MFIVNTSSQQCGEPKARARREMQTIYLSDELPQLLFCLLSVEICLSVSRSWPTKFYRGGTFCFKINQDCVTFKDIIVYWGLNSFEWSGRVRCRLPVSKHRLVILLSGSRCHLSRFVQPLTLPQQTAQRLGNIFYSSWCCVQWMSLTEMMNYILTYVF